MKNQEIAGAWRNTLGSRFVATLAMAALLLPCASARPQGIVGALQSEAEWREIARTVTELTADRYPGVAGRPTTLDLTRSRRAFGGHSAAARAALAVGGLVSSRVPSRDGDEIYSCAHEIYLHDCKFSQPGRVVVLMPLKHVTAGAVELVVHILEAGPSDLGRSEAVRRFSFTVLVSRDEAGAWTKSRITSYIVG